MSPRRLRFLLLLPVLLLAARATLAADVACGAPPPTLLVERFVSADCAECWKVAPPLPAGTPANARSFVLDWIVPSAQGDAAPLSVAAVPEAAGRAARAGNLLPDEALTQTTPLPPRSALHVELQDGVAWNGYIGLRLVARYTGQVALPAGLQAWLGLAERIDAGSEGTPVPRQLVRLLIGPLPLDELASQHRVEHLRAVRLPANAQPERLVAVGWLETPAGRVLAVGATADPACRDATATPAH